MEKCKKSAIVLIAAMLVSAIVSFIFLPDVIAIQWNSDGVCNTASRWILFIFPVIGSLIEFFHISNADKAKFKSSDLIGLAILLLAEGTIILNGFLDKI